MSQVIEWVMGLSLVRSVYIQLLSGFYQITWNQTGGGLPAQIFMHAPPRLSDLEIVRPDVSVCYNCKFQGTSLSLNSSIHQGSLNLFLAMALYSWFYFNFILGIDSPEMTGLNIDQISVELQKK